MVGDAGKKVREPDLWIDVTQPCGLNERIHDGGSFRPALRPREQPRFPPKREAATQIAQSERGNSERTTPQFA